MKYNRNGYSTGITDPDTRLTLQQFYFAFLVLFIGILVSFVQFLREKMHHYFEQQQLAEEIAELSKVLDAQVAKIELETKAKEEIGTGGSENA